MGNSTAFVTVLASLLIATPKPTQTQSTPNNWDKLMPTIYEVKKGDSLSTIAQNVYGGSEYWTVLWQDNRWINDPKVLYSDWKLTIRQEKPQPSDIVLPPDLEHKLADLQSVEHRQLLSSTDIAQAENRGKPKPSDYDAIYKAAGEKYGVPWQVLYGLHLTESGLQGSGNIKNKSGTGAIGPMQFMPGTWQAYGVDANGDGIPDITNVEDAIYSAANYLQKHGSLKQGLRSYGGNIQGTLNAARAKGFDAASIN